MSHASVSSRTVTRRTRAGPHDLEHHFANREPIVRELYDRVVSAISAIGPVVVLPEKTRIAFQVRMSFAQVTPRRQWLDGRRPRPPSRAPAFPKDRDDLRTQSRPSLSSRAASRHRQHVYRGCARHTRSGNSATSATLAPRRFSVPSLLAVDVGIRTGLAVFRDDGHLIWYRSQNFGAAARLKRAIPALLHEAFDPAYVVLEGGGPLVEHWTTLSERHGARVLRVSAEEWRSFFLLPRAALR